MKIYKKISLIAMLAVVITAASCKKLLVENPKSAEYGAFLGTPTGIFDAITGVYADLRYFYSSEGNIIGFYSGTDEQQYGGSAATTVFATYNGLNSGNTVSFSSMYEDINTLNGAIQYATAPGNSLTATQQQQYVAQAQFLRAFIYFYLVTTYGAVNSGGGVSEASNSGIALHTTFETAATTADQPATLVAVYNQIIADLTAAAANLPATITATDPFSGAGTGKTATIPTAQAYLAKVYLTRGYTAAAQSTDFQQAATITANLIANASQYGLGLWPDYSQEHNQANDYGQENLFAFDMGADPVYGDYSVGGSGGRGLNQLPVFFRWNYISNGGVNSCNTIPYSVSGAQPEYRDMYNGRPYIRSCPNTAYTLNYAFANQVNDSRFDATFQIFWICNQATAAGKDLNGNTKGTLVPTTPTSTTTYIPPTNGDTGILFPGLVNAQISAARRNAFKGMMVSTDQYNNVIFPTVKKFDDKIGRISMNDFSTRPVVEMRFSEVYMMNAEANYMLGNAQAAANSLNVIRQRAAYRTPADGTYIPASQYSVTSANMATANAANAAAMALTPAQIAQLGIPNNTSATSTTPCGMDLILDEYTREYYGDLRRWYDLTRTGQLLRRVNIWNPQAAQFIKPFDVVRPIPVGEIQTVVSGPAYPQNPGY